MRYKRRQRPSASPTPAFSTSILFRTSLRTWQTQWKAQQTGATGGEKVQTFGIRG